MTRITKHDANGVAHDLFAMDFSEVEGRMVTLAYTRPVDPVVTDRYDMVQTADTPTGSQMRPIKIIGPNNRKARRRRARELRCAGKANP